jgi:hypothetical protein
MVDREVVQPMAVATLNLPTNVIQIADYAVGRRRRSAAGRDIGHMGHAKLTKACVGEKQMQMLRGLRLSLICVLMMLTSPVVVFAEYAVVKAAIAVDKDTRPATVFASDTPELYAFFNLPEAEFSGFDGRVTPPSVQLRRPELCGTHSTRRARPKLSLPFL